IVGCGFVTADRHLPALRHVPEIEVVALADLDPRRAAEVSRRFGLRARAIEVESLLVDPGVDAVAVCTPPASHAELALAALEAGASAAAARSSTARSTTSTCGGSSSGPRSRRSSR